jgi:hypothetical protein
MKVNEMSWGMWDVWRGGWVREMLAGFWKQNLHVRDHSEDQDLDGIIILTLFIKKIEWEGSD